MLAGHERGRVSSWTVIGLLVGGSVAVVAVVVLALTARRAAGRVGPPPGGGSVAAPGAATSGVPPATVPPATVPPAGPSLTRRELVNRGIIGAFVAALSGVVASAVAYVWPNVDGQVGTRYVVGGVDDIRRRLAVDRRPYVGGNGRFYLVPFPTEHLVAARKVYPAPVLAGMEAGLVALSPVCTHQGCHVPYCASSAWFECPCHGSRYDGIGEQRRGPAPRGLDHYAVTVGGGLVTVDTSRTYLGPPPGTETVDDPAAGPHCF
jgi:cytochrome b6-f complex iron-sulfur subunit